MQIWGVYGTGRMYDNFCVRCNSNQLNLSLPPTLLSPGWLRLTCNSPSSCLNFLRVEVTGVYHHAQLSDLDFFSYHPPSSWLVTNLKFSSLVSVCLLLYKVYDWLQQDTGIPSLGPVKPCSTQGFPIPVTLQHHTALWFLLSVTSRLTI